MIKREKNPIFYLFIVALVILAILAVPVSAKKLATPVQIFPPNSYHSYSEERYVVLAWKPVGCAAYYTCEIQQKTGTNWVPFGGAITSNSAKGGPIPPGIYRWRIFANTSNPAETSNPSAWRTFDIINLNSTKLATPTLIGPPTGAIFYHSSPRVVYLEWKPVIGANEYWVWVKYYDQSGILKDLHNSPYLLDGTHLSGFLIDDFPGPYQGKWCVKAQDKTGAWLDSAPSAWRTFTFKN